MTIIFLGLSRTLFQSLILLNKILKLLLAKNKSYSDYMNNMLYCSGNTTTKGGNSEEILARK